MSLLRLAMSLLGVLGERRTGLESPLYLTAVLVSTLAAPYARLTEPSPTHSFDELINKGRPWCLLTAEQGSSMRQQILSVCHELVKARWPTIVADCPKCLELVVLDRSSMNDKGWKVSFNLVYPYLTFPCNSTILKEAATVFSNLSSQCFRGGDGTDSFLLIQLSTRGTGDFIYHPIINFRTYLPRSYVYQAILLFLRFVWHVQPVSTESHGQYLCLQALHSL